MPLRRAELLGVKENKILERTENSIPNRKQGLKLASKEEEEV